MVIAAAAMWRLTGGYSNDIFPHAQLAAEYAEDGSLLTYSLWYPLIWVSTGGGQPENFRAASVALLVIFVAAKALVAYGIAQSTRPHPWNSAVIAFGVTVFAPLVDPMAPRDVYLGQITATFWHNSTTSRSHLSRSSPSGVRSEPSAACQRSRRSWQGSRRPWRSPSSRTSASPCSRSSR